MAKETYKIPDTLDKSMGDMEISLQSGDGIGMRPMPIKIILMYVASAIVWFFAVAKTFIVDGGIGLIILFTVLWFALTALLLKRDKTGIPQASLVVSMLNYLPKNMRYVVTRNNALARDFYNIAGIDAIDGDKGLITFTDGTYGYMYRVVGTGSRLLFEEDRKAILDRVDKFYQKMKPEYELIFITSKEAQKIYRQVARLKERYDGLDFDDPELRAVADMEYNYLKNVVGGSFRSIHQYLIIKADNTEALTVAKNMLQSEVENSSYMFKQCTALFGDDIYDVFRTIYKGKESV